MRKYDLVISLGSNCHMASALKQMKITEKSYPFDWSDCDGDASERLLNKCNLIKNHFENAFNLGDFVEYRCSDPTMRGVKNSKTGIHYTHDFPWEKSVKDFFPEFLEKHQRRVNRLYDDVEKANNVLFLYQDYTGILPITAMKKAVALLKETFKGKNITLAVLIPVLSGNITDQPKLNFNIDNLIVLATHEDHNTTNPECDDFTKKIISSVLDIDNYSFLYDKDIICSGLSYIEPYCRWSDGEIVFFRLQTKLKEENVSVNIRVIAYINNLIQTQKCKIICNGHEISEMVFDKSDKQIINLIVPNDNDGNLDFVFEFDNLKSPKELGLSPDERKLGLGFIDAVISGE